MAVQAKPIPTPVQIKVGWEGHLTLANIKVVALFLKRMLTGKHFVLVESVYDLKNVPMVLVHQDITDADVKTEMGMAKDWGCFIQLWPARTEQQGRQTWYLVSDLTNDLAGNAHFSFQKDRVVIKHSRRGKTHTTVIVLEAVEQTE